MFNEDAVVSKVPALIAGRMLVVGSMGPIVADVSPLEVWSVISLQRPSCLLIRLIAARSCNTVCAFMFANLSYGLSTAIPIDPSSAFPSPHPCCCLSVLPMHAAFSPLSPHIISS